MRQSNGAEPCRVSRVSCLAATALQSHPLLSKLTELLPPEMLETLSTTAHLTLFLPSSTAFDSLSRPEWRYLNGRWPQAALDRVRLWGWHASGLGLGQGKVGYAERLRDQGTLNGEYADEGMMSQLTNMLITGLTFLFA